MTLPEYLADRGLTMAAFGAQIGRDKATVSRIVNGIQLPDLRTIVAIQRVTRGRVKAEDFLKDKTA